MGCSSSVAAQQPGKISIDTTNDQRIQQTRVNSGGLFNEKQRQIIKESWEQLQLQCSNIGKKVFLRVFEEDPSIKAAFDLGPAWGDRLINSDAFLKQATSFENSINYVVKNVDKMHTKCGPYMMAVGANHAESSAFLVQYFDSIEKAFWFVWQKELKGSFTAETKHSWQTLLRYIIEKATEGYNNASKDNSVDNQVSTLSKGSPS